MKNLEIIKQSNRLKIEEEAEDGIMGYYFDPVNQKKYFFIFSWSGGWEHLSISTPNKTPDWDTMCRVKELFWEDEEACVEYHPKKSEYVNQHPHCLHIWKPLNVELPTPPSIYVGYK